jgi:hypothetical protein
MYCIVFSGRLLDGYDPQIVRKAVASRLKLDAKQVERLFCGERVVLKKGVTEESGRLYLSVLRRLGMDAGMARIPRIAETVQALASFKIVFWGGILAGFEREAVMRAAATRLKASPAQLTRMFDGSKTVLKRGVSADMGTRYVVELARIGMQIDLEVETTGSAPALRTPVPEQIVVPSGPLAKGDLRPVGFRRHDDEMYAALLQTQFEMPGASAEAAEMMPAPLVTPAHVVRESSYSAPLPPAEKSLQMSPLQTDKLEPVRCEQCGHRQLLGSRCRVCGNEMLRSNPRPQIPMDASANATPTTILGNMPDAMMRSGVANSAALNQPSEDLRAMLQIQAQLPTKRFRRRGWVSAVIGSALVATLALWLIW